MKRQGAIDLTRGFIMILMALDHVNIFIGKEHFNEPWGLDFTYYTDIGQWLIRFVTHLCAPGFFFFMGMSMVLFTINRQGKKWSPKSIIQYFLKRGCFIILIMFLLEIPAWGINELNATVGEEGEVRLPGTGGSGYFIPTTVLFGLGFSMIVGSLLVFLNRWQLLIVTVLSFLISAYYINHADPTAVFHPFLLLTISPGSSGLFVLYPLVPWIGIVSFGMFWAKWMQAEPDKIHGYALAIGVALVGLFLLLRFSEVGNFQKNPYNDLISFFTLIKYPPSIAYASLTCGINLVLFYFFSIVKEGAWLKPIRLFGQTAMFYYIMHLYLYVVIGLVLSRGAALPSLLCIWLLGLIPLYYLCKWFLRFKRNKAPNSLWRMF